MHLGKALHALDRACERAGARWYLFGAQAAILRGAVRTTEDVDVTVDLGDGTTAALVHALQLQGLELRVADADEFISATRVLPLRHAESDTLVDVVLAGSWIEEQFFERTETLEIDGIRINVPVVEDLVVMKVLAGRPKDHDDVLAMLVASEHADAGRIRSSLREIESAIDSSDLVTAFDALERRAARALKNRR